MMTSVLRPLSETDRDRLKQAATEMRTHLNDTLAHPNLFLWLHDPDDAEAVRLLNELHAAVAQNFECHLEILPDIACLVVDSRKIEGLRDVLKRVFYSYWSPAQVSRTLNDVLTATDDQPVTSFRLADYSLFVPYTIRKQQPIRTHSFPHNPGYYRYRLCTYKTGPLPTPFREFLYRVFEDCPNHLYVMSGLRASQHYARLNVELQHTRQHEISEIARQSRGFERFSGRHDNVEYYCLEHDPKSIACEIPVWLEAAELADYQKVFETDLPLTGHIDLLRYAGGQIEVWDYKPHAKREVKAHVQVWLYALMLAVRTGLSLQRFRCGYFDEQDAYLFSPADVKISHDPMWR